MKISSHYKDLLRALHAAGTRYLIVGAHAVAHYSEPRYTKELDIWISRDPENAARVCGSG